MSLQTQSPILVARRNETRGICGSHFPSSDLRVNHSAKYYKCANLTPLEFMDNEGIDDTITLQVALTIITGCNYRVLEMLVTDNFLLSENSD